MIKSRPARLADVAELAGVSTSTAARVLRSGSHRVNPILAARVTAAGHELGYTPNLMAKSLREGSRPPLIGLMVGNMLDPYFASISESVTVEADNFGLAAMVTNMRRDPLREIELTRRFLEHRVSGVILSGGGYDQDTHQDLLTESLSALTNAGCYVASLTERNFDIPTFCADNDLIGQLAARALLDHGHSRIAVVYAPETSQVTRARRKATLGLLESRGCCVTEVVASYSREAGYAAADEVFASKRHDWPTGVIAGSDSLALGVLDYLNVHGVSVPEDVSVVGIGATYMSDFARPRLTSISVAVAESALAAVNYLANRIEGRDELARESELIAAPAIVDRGSIAAPRPQ